MGTRLLLLPGWARLPVWALAIAGLFWVCAAAFEPVGVGAALGFGLALALFLTYQSQPVHRAMTTALADLNPAQRSAAIGALARGPAPDDAAVRTAAARLGAARLADRTAEQLDRQERQIWLLLAVLVAAALAAAANDPTQWPRWLALGGLTGVALALAVVRTRRLRRRVTLLSQRP